MAAAAAAPPCRRGGRGGIERPLHLEVKLQRRVRVRAILCLADAKGNMMVFAPLPRDLRPMHV